jgi:hypothetical protein
MSVAQHIALFDQLGEELVELVEGLCWRSRPERLTLSGLRAPARTPPQAMAASHQDPGLVLEAFVLEPRLEDAAQAPAGAQAG